MSPMGKLWENYGKIMGKTMASHDSDPSDLIFVPWGPEFVTSVAKFPSMCGTRRVRPPCARGSSLRAKRLCSELGTWQSSCAVQIIVPCIGGNLWESYVWYILSLLPTMWWYNYIIYNTTWWQMNMYNYIVCNHIYIYNYLYIYIYIYTWLSAMMAYDWHHSCHSCHPMASLAPPSAVASPAATTPSFPSFPRRPRRPPWRPRRPPWRFGRHGLPGESVNALGKWWKKRVKNGWRLGEQWWGYAQKIGNLKFQSPEIGHFAKDMISFEGGSTQNFQQFSRTKLPLISTNFHLLELQALKTSLAKALKFNEPTGYVWKWGIHGYTPNYSHLVGVYPQL